MLTRHTKNRETKKDKQLNRITDKTYKKRQTMQTDELEKRGGTKQRKENIFNCIYSLVFRQRSCVFMQEAQM